MTACSRRRRRRGAVTVTVSDARGRVLGAPEAAGLAAWLAAAAPVQAAGHVAVALVSDARMRALNRTYRGVDAATDVLAFPAPRESVDRNGRRLLGDIAVARGVARRQARRLGHSARTEVRVLALHGLLHLLGYDHDTDRGEMARLEARLGRRAGLPEGLIGRPAVAPRRTVRR